MQRCPTQSVHHRQTQLAWLCASRSSEKLKGRRPPRQRGWCRHIRVRKGVGRLAHARGGQAVIDLLPLTPCHGALAAGVRPRIA